MKKRERKNSKYKGPEVRMRLKSSRDRKGVYGRILSKNQRGHGVGECFPS